jgi:hypothetical protein
MRQLMLYVTFKLCKNCEKLFVKNVFECLLKVSNFCMTMQLPTLLENHVKPLRRWVGKLPEHPPHSPDLTPSDFHLFGKLKEHLSGKRFASDQEVENETRD